MLQCFVCSSYTVEKKTMTKKWKKIKILPTYLSCIFGACNHQCCTQTYFLTVESVLVINMWNKYIVFINHSWISPTLQKGWELEFCLFFKKWSRVHFSPKKGEVGKIVEEWRLLRKNNLCLLANLGVYKSKKHYIPRYIYIYKSNRFYYIYTQIFEIKF